MSIQKMNLVDGCELKIRNFDPEFSKIFHSCPNKLIF